MLTGGMRHLHDGLMFKLRVKRGLDELTVAASTVDTSEETGLIRFLDLDGKIVALVPVAELESAVQVPVPPELAQYRRAAAENITDTGPAGVLARALDGLCCLVEQNGLHR